MGADRANGFYHPSWRGFLVYADRLPVAPEPDARRRLFVPVGAPREASAAMCAEDTPEAQLTRKCCGEAARR